MTQDTTQSVLFPDIYPKRVLVNFDQPDSRSDGGAVLLKAINTELQLTARLARCLDDKRESEKVVHQPFDLLWPRVFGIACGYPDCNDAGRLADDPVQKLLLDRDPKSPADYDQQGSHGLSYARRSDLIGVDRERVRLWTFARAAAEPRDDWKDDDTMALARAIAQ